MNVPAVPKPENPAFVDKVIVQLQDTLKNKLPWLDHSFGRCQRLVKIKDKSQYNYPGVHISNGEYINVFPDEKYKNFSFFIVEDPQNVDFRPHTTNNVRLKYAVVFWVNLDKIFANSTDRNTEALKAQIVKVLTRQTFLTFGRIDIRQIYEQAENIYKGFSIKEIDSQFLMQPYAGFRFEGEMMFTEDC